MTARRLTDEGRPAITELLAPRPMRRVDGVWMGAVDDVVTNTTTSIESELGKLQGLPTPVASWRVEVGLDATEEPAVWVWVTPEHDDVDAKTLADMRDIVRASVREMVGDDADWVYVRFPSASASE